MGAGVLCLGVKRKEREAKIRENPASRLRSVGALTLLLFYAFMTCTVTSFYNFHAKYILYKD